MKLPSVAVRRALAAACFLSLSAPAFSSAQTRENPEAREAAQAPVRVDLREVLLRARANPPTVRNALSRVTLAEAQVGTARAAYYPLLTISSSPSFSITDRPFLPSSSVTGVSQRLQSSSISVDASLQARMTLWDFGRTAANVRGAERARDAASEDLRLSALQSMTSAVAAYVTALNDREAISAAEATVAQREAHLRIAEGLVESGTRPPIERVRAQIDLETARIDLSVARGRAESDDAALAAALGLDPTRALDLAPLPEAALDADDDPARAADAAVAGRPEFTAARARLFQAQAQREAASASYRPVLSATVNGSASYTEVLAGRGLGGLGENASAGLNLSWSIFDPAVRANVAVAEANLATARATLEAQTLSVRTTAVQAAVAARNARVTLEQSEQLGRLATANLELATGRYQAGAAPLLELVDAQAADASARIAVVRARLNLYLARLQLLSATGGLERLARQR